MKTSPMMALVFGATMALGACADQQPTAPAADAPAVKRDAKATERAALLTNVPVTGSLADGTVPAGTFAGTFTAKRFDIDPATRALSMTGTLSGTATLLDGSEVPVSDQTFTAPVTLSRGDAIEGIGTQASSAACESGATTSVVSLVSFREVSAATCDILFPRARSPLSRPARPHGRSLPGGAGRERGEWCG